MRSQLILPPEVTDVHTHDPSKASYAILNRRFPLESLLSDAQWQSIGVHPWDADADINWETFRHIAEDPKVITIGEAGIDLLKGPELSVQKNMFIPQIEISENLEKPLILHVVKAYHYILELRHKLSPKMPWIIHGFRGNPTLGRQLTEAGIYLSLGEKYNQAVPLTIPPEYILRESD